MKTARSSLLACLKVLGIAAFALVLFVELLLVPEATRPQPSGNFGESYGPVMWLRKSAVVGGLLTMVFCILAIVLMSARARGARPPAPIQDHEE